MLDPNHDRRHLLDALRPPTGYKLDCAIGTTFSLDLVTLLTVPLAFAFAGWENDQGRMPDLLAVLESLREYAKRLHIFCQAGRISIPRSNPLLYTHLEESVFEVIVPNGHGVFHPKAWLLRLTAPDQPVVYRLLCLSRNLTFDRSWDTALVLDGQLMMDRSNAYAVNHPLGDFIATLPRLTLHPVPERVQKNVELIENEVRRVKFELPNGFSDYRFWPLGIEGARRWPFTGRIDRLLVISPFVTSDCLTRLTEQGNDHILISRLENLDGLPRDCFKGFRRIYYMDPAAQIEEGQVEDSAGDSDPDKADNGGSASAHLLNVETPLSGLHTKLYLADDGWDARIWTGSANATNAAFNANVEFLVELIGKRASHGIDVFLSQEKGKTSLLDLLQPFTRSQPPIHLDVVQQQLESDLESARRVMACAQVVVQVSSANEANTYYLALNSSPQDTFSLPAGVSARIWPITLPEVSAVAVGTNSKQLAEFKRLSFEALTSFFAFELLAVRGNAKMSCRFVLNLPLQGAPADRPQRILHALLKNREQVIRLLLLILAQQDQDATGVFQIRELLSGDSKGHIFGLSLSLLEPMVRALARDPARIEEIARLVADLNKTSEGQQLLPEGFDSVWTPIWSAHQRQSHE